MHGGYMLNAVDQRFHEYNQPLYDQRFGFLPKEKKGKGG